MEANSLDGAGLWAGRSRVELQVELHRARRTSARINWALWGIAAGVMVYGAGNVTALLLAHATPWPTAWLLSSMVDLGLCVALWGDRVLHMYGRSESWLTALRWITAAMTWALNVAGNALPVHGRADWVGVGIHSCGPLLLVVVAEAAGAIQRHVTAIIGDIESALSNTTARKPAPTAPTKPAPATRPTSTPDQRPGKDEIVAELANAIAADPDWTPDYAALMTRTGFSRSWCEKRVAEARTAARPGLHAVPNRASAISAESAELPAAGP